jgi:PST family polysaccharide transporter
LSVQGAQRTAVSGAKVLLAGQAVKVASQLISLAVLSRLLAPADFGVAAMVTAIVAVGEVIRDFGLSAASVQARALSSSQRSNLFWLNVTIGSALAVALFLGSPLVADFYDEPATADITRALAPFFILTAVGAQFRASLIRDTRFGSAAAAETLGCTLGVGVGIAAACAGAGVWALVAQQISTAAVCTSLMFRQSGWRPTMPRRHQGTMPLVRFGRDVFLTQLLGHVSRNLDTVIIGRMFGPVALGLYNRGFQLMVSPMSQINTPATSVALPVLSRAQDDQERFNVLVLRAQAALLAPLLALLGGVAVAAPAIVAVALGPGWEATVPVVRVLGIAVAFQGASYVPYWIFVSRGLTGRHLRLTLLTRPLLVGILLGGASFGVTGVAAAYALGTAMIWPTALWWLRGTPGVQVGALFRDGLVVVSCFGVAAGSGVWVESLLDDWQGVWLGLAAYAVVTALLWASYEQFRSLTAHGLRFVWSTVGLPTRRAHGR